MILEIDTTTPIPPFEQIRAQVADLAASGSLAPGARLPPIRQLAGDLGLAPGTVARAYRELEADGIVVSRVRHGTTIATQAARSRTDVRARLAEAARSYAVAARNLGVSREEALAAFDRQSGALPAS